MPVTFSRDHSLSSDLFPGKAHAVYHSAGAGP